MAKDDTASKRSAEEIARARYTINLQRAFNDLLPKLKRAYGQPAGDVEDARTQHVVALLAIAGFLDRMGPDYLADCANQFAKLAQALQDVNEGRRAPMLTPVLASRSDETLVWLARAYVALAVATMQQCGHNRPKAAKWAAKRYPGLEQLITESAAAYRSRDLEKAIISWCKDFSSGKVKKNRYAARVYSIGLDNLKAWASNCNSDQMEVEADKLLQHAVALL
jgi:hypothetical protein